MGKQWLLCKVAGDSSSGTFATGKQSNKKNTGKSRKRDGDKQMPSSSSSSFGGCMSALFHLFDLQHHHLPFHQPSFIPDEPNTILKGVEAPRNSLESEEQVAEPASSSSSSNPKQETNFNIPMRGIQIKTKRSLEDASSECSSSSPSTKTPNLVARLMGLDLLPENSSPRPSSSSPRVSSSSSYATPLNSLSKLSSHKCNTRSLPTTPRVSTTEGDYSHRFSLQISKENKRRSDESASEYAKQIAKQVRENIRRRVGADITNTVKQNEHRRDEYLVVLKPKRASPMSMDAATDRSRNLDQGHGRGKENYEPIPASCSSRLRLLEIKKNLNKPTNSSLLNSSLLSTSSEAIKAPTPSSATKLSPPLMKEETQVVKQDQKPLKAQKCKKIASEKYDLRLKNMHQQQEEPFMKPKLCNKKSTPLSNDLVKVNTSTKFISFKKDMASTPSTTVSSPKQVSNITQLPSCQSQSYNTNGNGITITPITNGNTTTDYSDYISRILSHTGIEKTTPISISHWYSPSHPLHPSIFQQLEKTWHPFSTTSSTNRKLIFDVVDELLVEVLKPYISLKPWALEPIRTQHLMSHRMLGSELVENLCEKIRFFPAADCQVLEDIDGLIAGDMKRATRVVGAVAFEEEAEELVAEMEREMVDTLVHEMAAGIVLVSHCGNKI